ncbi:uncharacterized protein CLUP02_10772 [Colletotrichum lupini]|uniref:Uncharacterized protein n=1 Tax=Colletotrichum lupini TaxID=145971 RepID=A0A9Q8SXK3_9PEZI|nr:uncharacterized protein CLUP02_10772 [Colletotrichum lupini]UQC85275.1 hypothetical protein CLUP02_10772 [Colletotrichum lupini]
MNDLIIITSLWVFVAKQEHLWLKNNTHGSMQEVSFLAYVRSTTNIRWRNTLSLYSLTQSPGGLDDGANATGRDCRETDLTTERRSLTTEVCPSWENASRSSERQNGITAAMSTTGVSGKGWTLRAGPGAAQGGCYCSSLAFLRGLSTFYPHSEFVSEQRLFRTGCGSTIVCSGLPVHNSTALLVVSSGCARHGTAQVGGLSISQLQVLFDTVLAEGAVVKADREVPEWSTGQPRVRNRVLIQNLDSLCGFHMVIIFGNPISLIADNDRRQKSERRALLRGKPGRVRIRRPTGSHLFHRGQAGTNSATADAAVNRIPSLSNPLGLSNENQPSSVTEVASKLYAPSALECGELTEDITVRTHARCRGTVPHFDFRSRGRDSSQGSGWLYRLREIVGGSASTGSTSRPPTKALTIAWPGPVNQPSIGHIPFKAVAVPETCVTLSIWDIMTGWESPRGVGPTKAVARPWGFDVWCSTTALPEEHSVALFATCAWTTLCSSLVLHPLYVNNNSFIRSSLHAKAISGPLTSGMTFRRWQDSAKLWIIPTHSGCRLLVIMPFTSGTILYRSKFYSAKPTVLYNYRHKVYNLCGMLLDAAMLV